MKAVFTILMVSCAKLERQEIVMLRMPVIKPDFTIIFKILATKPDATKHFSTPVKKPG
jgi:hypothetical protein